MAGNNGCGPFRLHRGHRPQRDSSPVRTNNNEYIQELRAFAGHSGEMSMLSLFCILLNIGFFFVLNQPIYTDRTLFPDGTVREWQRSPANRLYISGQQELMQLMTVIAVISILCNILLLFGVRNKTVRRICLISTVLAALLFIFIMIHTNNTHVNYA